MKMLRHDDERMQKELSLVAIFEDGSLKEVRIRRYLKKAAALRRYCGHENGYEFLAVPFAPEKHKRKARG